METQQTPKETQDQEQLLASLRDAAAAGNRDAQYRLGMAYANGEGVGLDFRAAAEWIEKSARQGLTEAQRTLAWLHANGYGVDQSNVEARRWFLEAAEAGDATAQCAVAAMYHFGRYDADKDADAALQWYRKAAEQGYARAQFALGKIMAQGKLVAQDDEAAFRWLTLAIMNGSEPAKRELSMLTAGLDEETLETFKARMLQSMQQQHPAGTA
jgi:TPR repeat protein